MFQLFNRFAWALSLCVWYVVILSLWSVWSGFKYMNSDEAFWIVFFWVLLGYLIKTFFFSRNFIEQRVRFFANAISGTDDISTPKIVEQPQPEVEEIVEVAEEIPKTETKPLEQTQKVSEVVQEKHEDSPLVLAIKGFFKENLLAKIGGILLFLWVLFFLNLIYTAVWPVAKVLIGIAFGFAVYGVGVYLDTKGFTNESRILLWLGILINYLVILSWRYLIGDNFAATDTIPTGVLSTGLTFVFLILNTVFWVVTSLVYQSRVLLLFSFVFAYINPLLVGGSSDTPYVLIWYSFIVALASVFLVWNKKFKVDGAILTYITFFWANWLFLIAPFATTTWWIVKILSFLLLTLILIYSFYKKEKYTQILYMIGFSYLFFLWFLFFGLGVLQFEMLSTYIYTILLLPLVWLFASTNAVWSYVSDNSKAISLLLLLPLVVFLIMMIIFPVWFSVSILVLAGAMYMWLLSAPDKSFLSPLKYTLAIGFAVFLIASEVFAPLTLTSAYSNAPIEAQTNLIEYILLLGVPLVFLLVSYALSLKKGLSNLYLIGTVGFICSTLQIITIVGSTGYMLASVMVLFIFWGANILIPFFSNSYLENTTTFRNYLLGFTLGILYSVFHIYLYMSEYYPGMAVGFALLAAGMIYFFVGYLRMLSFDTDLKKNALSFETNMVLAYIFWALSIFTLAIAFIFSGQQEIIGMVWLLESALVLYFFNVFKNYKMYIVSMILMFIGMWEIAQYSQNTDITYIFAVPVIVITIVLFINTKLLSGYSEKNIRIPHDVLHIFSVLVVLAIISDMVPASLVGVSHLLTAWYLAILGVMYHYYSSNIQKWFFVVLIWLASLIHLEEIERILNQSDLWYTLIQYLVSIILCGVGYMFAQSTLSWVQKTALLIITAFYGFIVSTIYVYNLFDTTFAITIYWWALAFVSLTYGISSDTIKLRTIGLYILFLTLGKILLYDIWIGFDDAILRVGALMVVGVMMIMVSMMYSKKYGNDLVWEFKIENLK